MWSIIHSLRQMLVLSHFMYNVIILTLALTATGSYHQKSQTRLQKTEKLLRHLTIIIHTRTCYSMFCQISFEYDVLICIFYSINNVFFLVLTIGRHRNITLSILQLMKKNTLFIWIMYARGERSANNWIIKPPMFLSESIIEISWFIECLSRSYDEEKIDMKSFDYKCIPEHVQQLGNKD